MPDTHYQVLLFRAIRDGEVTGWTTLKRFQEAHRLKFVPWGSTTAASPPAVTSLLRNLVRAGLVVGPDENFDNVVWMRTRSDVAPPRGRIVFDPGASRLSSIPPKPKLRIAVAPGWRDVQDALGISLVSLAELQRPQARVVVPMAFPTTGDDRHAAPPRDVFVAMPFLDELRPVYDDHVRAVCARLSLTVTRADDLFTTHAVMADVWGAITRARVVIADCTGRNANVFYEIGLAHALGTPVVLVSQRARDVPFDLRHLRYLRYKRTPSGMASFERDLEATVAQALAGVARSDA